MRFPDGPEHPLEGGDVTEGLVRIDHTVRRPHGPTSDAVARVLRHLEAVGFDGAPRYFGVDQQDRHVLSYITGEVAGRPWPQWVADTQRLTSLARLLRTYHDAVAPLGLPEWTTTIPAPTPEGLPDHVAGPPELIGHRDITPENVVFRDGRALALIDFDLLGPTTREEDLTNLLLWWAPWMPESDRPAALAGVDPAARTKIALDAYGLDDRTSLLPIAINLAERSWHLMRWRAKHLGGGWERMWKNGIGRSIVRRRDRLKQHGQSLQE